MKKWIELEQCDDYAILRKNFSDEMLDYFEEEIHYYLNDMADDELGDVSDIICWYVGSISTEDLLNTYYDCLTN